MSRPPDASPGVLLILNYWVRFSHKTGREVVRFAARLSRSPCHISCFIKER